MVENITISNKSGKVTEINIEGVIGVPEEMQFENSEHKTSTYARFRDVIDRIKGIEASRIVVNIRSCGGNVNDALLIYDTLCSLDCEITTRCFGYVASAATIIAQAASKGRREISANALYLIHRSVSTVEGNLNDMTETVELLNKTDERIASIYAARSGKAAEAFAVLMNCNNGNGKWLSPKEAREYLLVDRIIGAEKISNAARCLIRNLELPEPPSDRQTLGQTIRKYWTFVQESLRLEQGRACPSDVMSEAVEVPAGSLKSQAEEDKQALGCKDCQGETDNAQGPKNKISYLDEVDERLHVTATQTMPKEDPPVSESAQSINSLSYSEDVKSFKM